MLKNYLTIAIRNLFRHKVYAIINMLGLAIGMAGAIVIGLYVYEEFRVDRHHKHADHIYRVIRTTRSNPGDAPKFALKNPGMLGPDTSATLPEVESATRLRDVRRSNGNDHRHR